MNLSSVASSPSSSIRRAIANPFACSPHNSVAKARGPGHRSSGLSESPKTASSVASRSIAKKGPPDFTGLADVVAHPALAENGLFRHLETLPVLSGYYMTLQVILLLAYMALCRIKAVEQLQYETPGELGKLLGLDPIRFT